MTQCISFMEYWKNKTSYSTSKTSYVNRLRLCIPYRSKAERACIRKKWKVFFLSSLETIVIKEISNEIKLENVENVEQLFHRLERSGQWPDAHPKLEKELS